MPAVQPERVPVELPAHPRLRPGLRVTRRDDHHLQVGLEQASLVLPDTPATRQALADLGAGRQPDPEHPQSVALCRELTARGLIVDGRALVADLPAEASAAGAVAALYAQAGPTATDLLAARRRSAVRVQAPTAAAWAAELAVRLLADQGIEAGAGSAVGAGPDVALLVALGEPDRSVLDDLVRAGQPHLLVRTVEGVVTLGPFVVPGVTACQRCVDGHGAVVDPRRSLVVEQYAAPRASDGLPEPVDPALLTLAVAWAARDLVSFLDGELPGTWSATVRLAPGLRVDQRTWHRHPACGCAWPELAG